MLMATQVRNTVPRVSIVIPVYNEADTITDCLQAIARQTRAPYEVIVVDNNSTDETAMLAERYPFARVIEAAMQGVVYARDAGFNAATGDIIGRIDADTIVSKTWVADVQALFASQQVDIVSGKITFRDVAFRKTANRVDLFWRRRMAACLGPLVAMQGANMALRASVWRDVAHTVCHKSGQHEDFDIGIHAWRKGFALQFTENLSVSISSRRGASNIKAFIQYAMIGPRTYLAHGLRQGRSMYQVVAFVVLLYPVIVMMSRGYDPTLGRFSVSKLFASSSDALRVNPATFVD